MARERRLAILFADVCGSTRLYDSIGDARAQDTVARCLRLMSEATDRNRGRVVKTIGDEVMATFDSVDAAVQAGAEMQEAITEQLVGGGNDIQSRVGCHCGMVMLDDGAWVGDA